MAELANVTAPLVIRFPDSREQVVAACFPHPLGVLYLDLFWHLNSPAESAHLLRGELSGDGPWRVGDARIRVLGCNHTDPHLMDQYGPWQAYLENDDGQYPPPAQVREIAARLGAIV